MRFPLRVVGDYHVDRQEVYAQQCVQLTCTNCPTSFSKEGYARSWISPDCGLKEVLGPEVLSQVIYCGGYSGEEPPLPIPNREVKLTIADGTATPGGRVGSCRSSTSRLEKSSRDVLYIYPWCYQGYTYLIVLFYGMSLLDVFREKRSDFISS